MGVSELRTGEKSTLVARYPLPGYAASFSSAEVQFIEGENFVQKPFAFATLIDTVARHLPLLPAVTH